MPSDGQVRFAATLLAVMAGTALVVFTAANRHLRGMLSVASGVTINVAAIIGNRFMPVSLPNSTEHGAAQVLDGVHQLASNPALAWLGDVVRIPLSKQVLSVGDLLLLVGIARMTFALTQPPDWNKEPHRRRIEPPRRDPEWWTSVRP
jgi:hypothetical protein